MNRRTAQLKHDSDPDEALHVGQGYIEDDTGSRESSWASTSDGLPRAKVGSVERGKHADLVLWSGDPLELSSFAEKVFIGGVEQRLRTRQTKLVERSLERVKAAPKK